MKFFLSLFSLVCLTSCSSPSIKARSFYTSRQDLASYMLDTPDPDKTTTGLGQVLWVRWFCPQIDDEIVIDATLRFKDESDRHEIYPVQSRYGWLMIEIPTDERTKKGDLVSYNIVLRRANTILTSTKHKLWVEKIEIKDL